MSSEEGSSARSKSGKVKFLDSKQAYVRAMNADGVTVIEGTGESVHRVLRQLILTYVSHMVCTVQGNLARS